MTTYPLEVSYQLLDAEIENYSKIIETIERIIPIIKNLDGTEAAGIPIGTELKKISMNLKVAASVDTYNIIYRIPEATYHSTILDKDFYIEEINRYLCWNSYREADGIFYGDTNNFKAENIIKQLELTKQSFISLSNKLILERKNIKIIIEDYESVVKLANDFNKRISVTTKKFFNFRDNFTI